MSQMGLDGATGQEQCLSDLRVGPAVCGKARNPSLARCQRFWAASTGSVRPGSGGKKLLAGPFSERRRTAAGCLVERVVQQPACVRAATTSAECRCQVHPGPCVLEHGG